MPETKEFSVELLVPVRCPNVRYMPQYKKLMPCNRLCAEVMAGSAGRAFCPSCRTYGKKQGDSGINPFFWFKIDANYQPKTPNIKYIKAKK